jgi:homoserine O-acetyltransferase
MNHHDVGRGCGGVARALEGITAQVAVGGIASDRLYPLPLQHELVRLIPGGRPVSVVDSASGHDGFLLETGQVGRLIASTLDQ